jgi:hypothetical protein
MRNEIKSLHKKDDEYIARITSKLNNDYHTFLTSCIHANEDIEKVNWKPLEDCSDEIRTSLQKRDPLGFVLTDMIQSVIDQSKRELKRKHEDEAGAKTRTGGFSPTAKKPKRGKKGRGNRNRDSSDDDDSDREVDPQCHNPKLNPNWKMSWKDFRKIISPRVDGCPKINDKSVCAMFNIVGECYFGSRCNHSHEDLPKKVKDEMQKWIDDCKEKASKNDKKKNGGKKKD